MLRKSFSTSRDAEIGQNKIRIKTLDYIYLFFVVCSTIIMTEDSTVENQTNGEIDNSHQPLPSISMIICLNIIGRSSLTFLIRNGNGNKYEFYY
jgi:hypothetical protein